MNSFKFFIKIERLILSKTAYLSTESNFYWLLITQNVIFAILNSKNGFKCSLNF